MEQAVGSILKEANDGAVDNVAQWEQQLHKTLNDISTGESATRSQHELTESGEIHSTESEKRPLPGGQAVVKHSRTVSTPENSTDASTIDLDQTIHTPADHFNASSDIQAERQEPEDAVQGANSDRDALSIDYPQGFRLVTLTLGVMAYVLMVALDNYILAQGYSQFTKPLVLFFMPSLTYTTATAVPRIATDFQSLSSVGWYASSYFLTQMAFQPCFGHLFNDFPPKYMFFLAMGIFEIGSIVCAAAPSSPALIVGRLIAGTGGAGLYVGTLVAISDAVPIRKRPAYLSIVTSMFGVASVAGPLLGGVFTDSERLTWRFCFWINLPIGFIASLLIGFFYKSPRRPSRPSPFSPVALFLKLDPLGITTLISAFVCFTLALQWAEISYSWHYSHVWGCLLGFILLLLAFVADQIWRGKDASFPLQLITLRAVWAPSTFLLFIQLQVGILIYYLPFYFQAVLASSAYTSGIQNLPFLITLLFAPMLSGALIAKIGIYVPFMYIGALLSTIGSALLFTLTPHTSKPALYGFQFLTGLGLGSCNQLSYSVVQFKVKPEVLVMGSAMVSFCNSLGPVLGTNVAQAVFTASLRGRLGGLQGLNVIDVIRGGPTEIAHTVPEMWQGVVREAFNFAVTRSFVPAIVGGGLAVLCCFGVEWGDVRRGGGGRVGGGQGEGRGERGEGRGEVER